MKNIGLLLPLFSFLLLTDPVLGRGKVPRLDLSLSANSGDDAPGFTASDPVQSQTLFSALSSSSDGSQTPGWEFASTEMPLTQEEQSSQSEDLETQETQDPDPLDPPSAIEGAPPASQSSPSLNRRMALVGPLLLAAFGIMDAVSGRQ